MKTLITIASLLGAIYLAKAWLTDIKTVWMEQQTREYIQASE